MALFGFHIVSTLITFTIFVKFRVRFSFTKYLFSERFFCYILPSDKELKAKLFASEPRKSRKHKFDRGTTFSLPMSFEISLDSLPIRYTDIEQLPFFVMLSWIVDFSFFSLLNYAISEVFCFLFPLNSDFNVSILWIILAIAFLIQGLVNINAHLFFGNDVKSERNFLLCFASVFFLISLIFLAFGEGFFDTGVAAAYESFSSAAFNFFNAIDVNDIQRNHSPLILFISLSLMFGILSSLMVFPNLRYARMYTNAVINATAIRKLGYHFVFLAQIVPLALYCKPIREYLVKNPRTAFSSEQIACMCITCTIAVSSVRIAFYRIHLQSYLNQAEISLRKLRTQAGSVKNTELRHIVCRYFTYFNVASMQYFIPALIQLLIALLLKTLGNHSWLGSEVSHTHLSFEKLHSLTDSNSFASIRLLFNETVQHGVWSVCLVFTLLVNGALSIFGVIYSSYFENV